MCKECEKKTAIESDEKIKLASELQIVCKRLEDLDCLYTAVERRPYAMPSQGYFERQILSTNFSGADAADVERLTKLLKSTQELEKLLVKLTRIVRKRAKENIREEQCKEMVEKRAEIEKLQTELREMQKNIDCGD